MKTLPPLLLACIGLLFSSLNLQAAPGDLDPAFGMGGKVVTDFSSGNDQPASMALQSDGKLLVAGSTSSNNNDFLLVRYNMDGSLDAGFGSGGKVTTEFNATRADGAASVALQGDGRIVVAGYTNNGGNDDFALARYHADGSLDASFGNGGKVTTFFGSSNERAQSVVLQTDGKIVAAGHTSISGIFFAISRYNTDGSLDSTFGSGGKVTTAIGSNPSAYGVTMQDDGKILVAGQTTVSSNVDFALVRYNADGSLDTSFNGTGKVTTAVGSGQDRGQSVVVQNDGRIVVAGYATNGAFTDVALVRYNTNGSLDTSLSGGTGKVITSVSATDDSAYNVKLLSNGEIVVAGSAANGSNSDFALVCYNSDGSLDVNFGTGGIVTTDFGTNYDYGASVSVQSDGKIVVTGVVLTSSGNNDFALARYLDAAAAPVVITSGGSGLTETTAVLRGTVISASADTTYYFEYGLTTAYGFTTTTLPIGGTGTVIAQAPVSGLISGATYHYRIFATNSAGTTAGQDATFAPVQPLRYEKVAVFSQPTGTAPLAGLIQGLDGNFYCTTSAGGSQGKGTVFKLTPLGKLTTLVDFSGPDGDQPRSGIIQASDGNFYGTTYYGGSDDRGIVFKLTPAGDLTTLASFNNNNGSNPGTKLFEANDGSLYGTTEFGGLNSGLAQDRGSIFKVTKSGTLTKLVNMGTSGISAQNPNGDDSLMQASDGHLYMASDNYVLRLTLNGVVSNFYQFTSSVNGQIPNSPLVSGADGLFYGTGASGGTDSFGVGFKLSPGGVYTRLCSFTLATGKYPRAVILAADGAYYGVTTQGGSFNLGTFFRMHADGQLDVLAHFPTGIGSPNKDLIQALDGNFYGTTVSSVFKLTPTGAMTTVLNLTGFNGRHERVSLIQTNDGSLYGTGSSSGAQQEGNIFQVSPGGALTPLASFDGTTLGSDPGTALVEAVDGNYYGTARTGGANGKGTVFRMSAAGVLTVLVNFDGTNGATPEAGLVQTGDGHLYGTTREGGSNNLGTVFRLTTGGVFTVLKHFTGTDGSVPLHRMIAAIDGNLYGTTAAGGTSGNGIVYRVTPASGTVTTVAEFAGTNGQSPNELRQLPDGTFVGTTRLGGSSNFGTIFQMAADGTIAVLHHFNGTNGQWPESVLARSADGTLYGTTTAGATGDGGTLFKVAAGGIFVPIMDFGSVPDEKPTGPVFFGQDGNLYGTTRNSVFRFLFPGAPIPDAGSASGVTTTSAVIDAKVNARGSSTQSTIEYGIDGVSFPLSATAAPLSVSGYTTTRVGATLAGLVSGTRYYYRLRSVSNVGTTVSPVASFATQSLAYAATTPASGLGPTSATLNGIVNAFENSTAVTFEYGTDGNAFPFSIAATPATVTGDADTSVAAAIAGLTKGVTYFFRIRATTTAGTTISGATSFRTLIEPLAATGPALALTTTTARVTATVQARDADTQVFFEYGTSPTTFPNIIAAIPGLVTGDTPISVAADLPNLSAGVNYYFRVRASSAGGLAYSAASSFQLQVLSGFTQVFPPAPPASEGFLVVNLTPSGILHGWRFVGEQQWRASGVPAGGLTTGDRDIEFRPVPGYNQPPTESMGIVSGEAATVITRDYYESSTSGSGGLSVTLKPDSITTGQDRAQWRLLGENDAHWRDSGAGISSLIAGSYLIECKPVTGRATPPNVNVIVSNGATAAPTITYFLPDATAGAPPSVLAFESVTGDTTKPYAHVGQIRSNAGSSSGFVVKARVVATAAHVVWDDGTLSAAQGLQWLFQRHRGTHEPKPVFPRGFYLFDGYAAQRVLDNSPGDSSPQSQTLDVAAMYFDQDAGRGGYGGFLASDLTSNEFLLSNANKMLVGYPVDGVAPTSQGRMHATAPFNVVFNAAFGRTFTTTGIRSSGGNSGGPLCVQFEGGAYYPAAIYLGGDNQTVVRAIDSSVIDLFNRAEVSGNGGGNNTGGGITHTGVTGQLSPSNPGRFQVFIEPAAARIAGAGWSMVPASLTPTSTYRQHGAQTANLKAGDYKVVFLTVGGFQPPEAQSITVSGGQVNTYTYTYALPMTPQETWRQTYFSSTANTGNAADTFDYDGDRFTNAQEYAAGTNPTLSGDFFKAENPQRSGSTFTLSTAGKAGRTYVLERSATLTGGSWSAIATQGPLAADGVVTLSDAASSGSAFFYHIRVTGP